MNTSKNIYISPSLLAADYTELGASVRRIEESGADFLHLDIMDGHFVPNISFGPDLIAALRPRTSLIFDVHLMISDPAKYLDRFISAGADIITFHREAVADPAPLIARIEVDGGISADNTALVTVAGANVIVAGSAIFGSPRPRQTILAMRAAAKDNPYCEE